MSWLAPLYLLGGLSIAIPIWLHWIQRRPRGERAFSSLMFLTPSLPRTQRRHRLNHWWLLLLRGLALSLLALAFARPFLRSKQDERTSGLKRLVAICLDRSGSMQRTGLWQQAQQQLADVLGSLSPEDHVALFTFDQKLELVVPWAPADSASLANLRESAQRIRPGYARTILGRTLVDTLGQFPVLREMTSDGEGRLRAANNRRRQVVIISDMTEGTDLNALDRYRWPREVPVEIRRVSATGVNGSVRLVSDAADLAETQPKVRVRVSSDKNAAAQTFRVAWSKSRGGGLATTVSKSTGGKQNDPAAVAESVQVPPGGSRVVVLPTSSQSTSIHLEGDDHAYDNDWFVAQQTPTEKSVIYVGSTADVPDSLAYYLRRADLSTANVLVKLNILGPTEQLPEALDPVETPLVIHAGPPSDASVERWQRYLDRGGRMLVVLESAAPLGINENTSESQSAGMSQNAAGLAKLCGAESLKIEPVECQEYALWANVDYHSELFAPFREAQYNDFSKIRVWRYHRLSSGSDPSWHTLVSYDDQSPALLQRNVGQGLLLVLTTSWVPRDSQLALSTKFVPMLALWMGGELAVEGPQQEPLVGDPLPLKQPTVSPVAKDSTRDSATAAWEIERPDGRVEWLSSTEEAYVQTDVPGIYTIRTSGQSQSWAVNLPPEESRTAALDESELTRRGLVLDATQNAVELQEQTQRKEEHELEAEQSWWRWLLVACLAVLALETYLAGRADRSRPDSELLPQTTS